MCHDRFCIYGRQSWRKASLEYPVIYIITACYESERGLHV